MATFLAAIPALPVSDISRSIRFFHEVLHFRVAHQDESFAVLKREEVELHLWLASDLDWKSRSGSLPVVSGAESFIAGTASCRVQVAGVNELYTELQPSSTVHPNGKLEEKPWGGREFAVSDPDCNLVTFFEQL